MSYSKVFGSCMIIFGLGFSLQAYPQGYGANLSDADPNNPGFNMQWNTSLGPEFMNLSLDNNCQVWCSSSDSACADFANYAMWYPDYARLYNQLGNAQCNGSVNWPIYSQILQQGSIVIPLAEGVSKDPKQKTSKQPSRILFQKR
jgi:hypothetical protein